MAATDKQKLDELFAGIESENENVRKMMDEIAAKEKLAYGESGNVEQARKTLAERFIVPPFSVLDARQGYWQERKKAWIGLGVAGKRGRDNTSVFNEGAYPACLFEMRNEMRNKTGVDPEWSVVVEKAIQIGTYTPPMISIVDPVLCEVAYRWFCPANGLIINPTAGESVYGLVASYLGYRYKGVELREEQVEANREQNTEMGLSAEWILGDGQDVYSLVSEDADFIMCCPPYLDLEVYSDDPRDLSAMEYEEFIGVYRKIISESVRRLKDNRFAFFVVGDVRDKKGVYRDFIGSTIQAFKDAGCDLYNQAVLIEASLSAPMRANRQFSAGRKFVKTHQNVLVFVKGDWREAVKACGDVEVSFPNE